MSIDEIRHENAAATERIRSFGASLTDEELRRPVGEHWTVAVVFAHLAFWDRRAMDALDRSEREGRPTGFTVPTEVNDLSLPLWRAIEPREAVRLAVEAAQAANARVASLDAGVLAAVLEAQPRWVRRSLHRNEHLDEAEAALGR